MIQIKLSFKLCCLQKAEFLHKICKLIINLSMQLNHNFNSVNFKQRCHNQSDKYCHNPIYLKSCQSEARAISRLSHNSHNFCSYHSQQTGNTGLPRVEILKSREKLIRLKSHFQLISGQTAYSRNVIKAGRETCILLYSAQLPALHGLITFLRVLTLCFRLLLQELETK